MSRRWFNVGVVKIPHADRDVAHAVLGDRPDDGMWQDIVGADTVDDDDRFPVGSDCTYRAALTDEEAEQFRAASNCRYVAEDVLVQGVTSAPTTMPGWRTRKTIGYWPTATAQLPGTSTTVAVMDTGSSSLVRSYMNVSYYARGVFPATAPPTGENYAGVDHGSLCLSDAVPYGGRYMDCIIIDGNDSSTDAVVAQGVTWCVNNGAKVVSGSFGFGSTTMPATLDALNAASGTDIVFYFAAGNDGSNAVAYPARYHITNGISYIYSVGGWDMSTNYRWMSNGFAAQYQAQMTGVAPSIFVYGYLSSGIETDWMGTSAATPCVANMCARLTGGGVTARQAGAALKNTTVNMGTGVNEGGGMFNLRAAAEYLGLVPAARTVSPYALRATSAGMWAGAAL